MARQGTHTKLEIVSQGIAQALRLPTGSAALVAAGIVTHVQAQDPALVQPLLATVPRKEARRLIRALGKDRDGVLSALRARGA